MCVLMFAVIYMALMANIEFRHDKPGAELAEEPHPKKRKVETFDNWPAQTDLPSHVRISKRPPG